MEIVSLFACSLVGIGSVPTVVNAPETIAGHAEEACRRRAENLRFCVTSGSRLRKSFERELRLTTRSEARGVAAGFGLDLELGDWHDTQRVVLVDEYGDMNGSLPASITRQFERVEMEHTHEWSIPGVFGREFSGTVERKGRGELEGGVVSVGSTFRFLE